MAKVLKEAIDNEKLWRGEFTCTGAGYAQHGSKPCGRLIEVLASDVVAEGYTDYGGGHDICYGFICPACGVKTEIPSSKLPFDVQSMAKKSLR